MGTQIISITFCTANMKENILLGNWFFFKEKSTYFCTCYCDSVAPKTQMWALSWAKQHRWGCVYAVYIKQWHFWCLFFHEVSNHSELLLSQLHRKHFPFSVSRTRTVFSLEKPTWTAHYLSMPKLHLLIRFSPVLLYQECACASGHQQNQKLVSHTH